MNRLILFLLMAFLFMACAPANVPATNTPAPTNTQITEMIVPTETALPIPQTENVPFTLTSNAFINNGDIPNQYAYSFGGQCKGENISPHLAWFGAPSGTQSFAILILDPDGGNWVHWLQFNIPADVNELPEFVGGAEIGIKGKNDFGELGYGGPCPPSGTHRYVFTLYALDIQVPLSQGVTKDEFLQSINGHVLGEAVLMGLKSK